MNGPIGQLADLVKPRRHHNGQNSENRDREDDRHYIAAPKIDAPDPHAYPLLSAKQMHGWCGATPALRAGTIKLRYYPLLAVKITEQGNEHDRRKWHGPRHLDGKPL